LPWVLPRFWTERLFADAHAVDAQTQITTAAWATLDIKRAGFSGGAIGVKWIVVRLFVVFIARKLAAGAHAIDPPGWLDASAARRAVGIKCACHGLRAGKRQYQCNEPIFREGYLHGVIGVDGRENCFLLAQDAGSFVEGKGYLNIGQNLLLAAGLIEPA
jgi:hypothetical protein